MKFRGLLSLSREEMVNALRNYPKGGALVDEILRLDAELRLKRLELEGLRHRRKDLAHKRRTE